MNQVKIVNSAILLLFISSTPALACSISIANQSSDEITLKSSEPKIKQVGTIVEDCAEEDGYTITITSENLSKLKSNRASYPYQVSYGNEPFVGLEIPYEKLYSESTESSVRSVRILTGINQSPVAGTYSDVLMISIGSR